MKNDIENANKITLNKIQNALNITVRKTAFLKMIFPESLKNNAPDGVLDFIFEADSSYQSSRTSFFNGNIYKKGLVYSRAHQSELNYIAAQLNSSDTFNEMTDLISKNFNISMKHEVFLLLSLDSEKYPRNVKDIINIYQNENKPCELLALMILWSIFGEWITLISFDKEKNKKNSATGDHTDNTLTYFHKTISQSKEIESIDCAFQSGALWLTDAARTYLLTELINSKVKINVLIASFDPTEHIENNVRYTKEFFHTLHAMWNIFGKKYPKYVEIRVSPVPLIHNYYCFNMKDNLKNTMRLNFYTRHNPYIDKNPVYYYDVSSEYYKLFKDEFSYLWDISDNI